MTSHAHYAASRLMSMGSGMLGDRGPSLEFKVSCTINLIYILFWFQKPDMRCLHLFWHHFQDCLMRTWNVSWACSKSIYALTLYPALGLSTELSW